MVTGPVGTLSVSLSQSVVAAGAGMLNVESLHHWPQQPLTGPTTDPLCQQPGDPRVDLLCAQPHPELPVKPPAGLC